MKIPKVKLVPMPETEEEKQAISYTWNKEIGTRHFLGGESEDINNTDYPRCESCKNQMSFYAQIDSIGEKYDLADCMVIHTFICFDCFTVHSRLAQI
ncbi:MAG: hypothetical protein K0S32_2141 [Bacteroidetes bacterium]|jgi:hypothetical protein|nr:hypothetical protein [Bacteroidota bacterium]